MELNPQLGTVTNEEPKLTETIVEVTPVSSTPKLVVKSLKY